MRAARLIAAVVLLLQGWSALGQALPPYKMIDSGFPVDVLSGKDIRWIDDDRVLCRDATSPGIETAIPRQAGAIEVRYMPWAKQYLVIGNPGSDAKTYPAWYLRPDGSTTEVKWPAGEWQAASNYLPTRRGLLVWAKTVSPSGSVYGHFLLTGGVATRIAPGFYWKGASVSPDGCKVAFRHALNREDEARGYAEWKAGRPANTLRMIDVCAPTRAAQDSLPLVCPPGEKIQWIADYCMAKIQTDDEIAASDCISTEDKITFRNACGAKLHFKRALCEIVVQAGTRSGTVDSCVTDETFAGNTVRNGGVGGTPADRSRPAGSVGR